MYVMARAVASGVKGGDDYRGRAGSPGDLNRLAEASLKKTIRTVDGPLLHVVTKAYHLHVFLSLANLNIQNSLKHSGPGNPSYGPRYGTSSQSADAFSYICKVLHMDTDLLTLSLAFLVLMILAASLIPVLVSVHLCTLPKRPLMIQILNMVVKKM